MREQATGYAEVNGGRLYHEVAGEGRPLVLLHGGLVDSGLWDRLFPVFSGHCRTVRYDLRGFGRSSQAGEGYSHHEDLRALLDFLGIERAHVLGLSMSGEVAIDFALAYPERVTALLPVASGLGGWEPENIPDEFVELGAAEEAALGRGDVAEAVAVSLRMWTDGPGRTPDQVDPAVRERVREMTTQLYGRGEQGSPRPLDPPAASRLGEIQAPTLAIVGDEDVPFMLEIAEVVARGVPGARKVVIPGTAHHLNLEKPDEFNRAVLDFLGEVG